MDALPRSDQRGPGPPRAGAALRGWLGLLRLGCSTRMRFEMLRRFPEPAHLFRAAARSGGQAHLPHSILRAIEALSWASVETD